MQIECTKTRFATEKDAAFYISKIKNKSTRDVIPTRSYLCRCGAWHLTSKKDFVGENNELLLKVTFLEEQVKKLKIENELLKNKNGFIGNTLGVNEQVKFLQTELQSLKNQNNK